MDPESLLLYWEGSIFTHINPVHAPTSSYFKIYSIIILPFTPRSSKSYTSFTFPRQNSPWISVLLHAFHMALPSHLILLDFISRIIFGEEQNHEILLFNFLQLSSTLFSQLLCPYSSVNVITTKNNGKIVIISTFIFVFLVRKWEDKIFRTEWWQTFHKCDKLIISSCT